MLMPERLAASGAVTKWKGKKQTRGRTIRASSPRRPRDVVAVGRREERQKKKAQMSVRVGRLASDVTARDPGLLFALPRVSILPAVNSASKSGILRKTPAAARLAHAIDPPASVRYFSPASSRSVWRSLEGKFPSRPRLAGLVRRSGRVVNGENALRVYRARTGAVKRASSCGFCYRRRGHYSAIVANRFRSGHYRAMIVCARTRTLETGARSSLASRPIDRRVRSDHGRVGVAELPAKIGRERGFRPHSN